jgi:anti-anti-sigma factor
MSIPVALQEQSNCVVLTLDAQQLKHPVVNAFKETLYSQLSLVPTEKACLIDFSQVNYMDSFSLAVILSIFKHCRETGRLMALTHLNEQVRKLIQLTRLESILPAYANNAEAAEGIKHMPAIASEPLV